MPKPRDLYTQLQACNFPFNHSTIFQTQAKSNFSSCLKSKQNEKQKLKENRKDIRGKERGNSATTSGGDANEKCCQ